MLRASTWMTRWRKQINLTLSAREQNNAAKLVRRGDPLFLLPLFTPKNTSYEFHGNGWWTESATFTRSPFFKYKSQFSKFGPLPVLVPLPDKLLLIPQDPAQTSSVGAPWTPPGRTCGSLSFVPKAFIHILQGYIVMLSPTYVSVSSSKLGAPRGMALPCSFSHPQYLTNTYYWENRWLRRHKDARGHSDGPLLWEGISVTMRQTFP